MPHGFVVYCQAVSLSVTLVEDPAQLSALRAGWLALSARAERDELMTSPLWLEPWWTVFGPHDGRRLAVVTVHDGGELVGLVPLCRRRVQVAPGLRLRRLEPLGTGEDEADEICSDFLGIVAARGKMPAVADAFVGAMADGALGGGVDELIVPALAGDAECKPELTRALRRRGWHVDFETTPPSPYIPVPKKFDDYLNALHGDKRYMVRRSLRDFEKWAAGKDVVHEAKDEASRAEGMRVLGSLHGERWQAAGHEGAFASTKFADFHTDASRRLLAAGALELLWLTVDGDPVAAVYNVVWGGKTYFYQAGRKMEVPGKIRPGVVLHMRALERAIAAGRREYDFLAGTSRYKMDLALATRPLFTLRAARPGWRAQAYQLYQLGRAQAKLLRDRWRARRGGNGVETAAPAPHEATDGEA
jgi:CelD/BcsL family acetyltransferase involved in cellulose biosynthesis